MKKKLTITESIIVASMLFGMFFGAGNLIFPVHMGQLAGSNMLPAVIGFIVTGVGIPLLGVAALGISKSSGLYEMASRVGKGYGMFFTCALYLTIGPCFAIPRCASTSFTVGVAPLVAERKTALYSFIFTAVFLGVALLFTLKPNKILTWVGKIINPVFLIFLVALVAISIASPTATISSVTPDESYATGAFFNGFLEGYNTMDAIAALAFGIVVVNVIKDLGVEKEDDVASSTVKAGILSCLLMAVVYVGVTVIGVQSRGLFPVSENGGIALADICGHYFGKLGQIFLAVTVTLACLKTAIGLLTSVSEALAKMFPKTPGYRFWAILLCVFSLAVANIGLNSIIKYAVPVLMFLYPLAMTLILLSLFGRLFQHDKAVYVSVTSFTLVAALFDFIKSLGGTLPEGISEKIGLNVITGVAEKILPLFGIGLGWLVPAGIGLVIGLIIHFAKGNKSGAATAR